MSTQYPPLPYRRLKLMANGIWDEVNKAFYPWKHASATTAGKAGIMYYVKSVTLSGFYTGIVAAGYVKFLYYVGGVNAGPHIGLPQMTQATDFAHSVVDVDISTLCDPGTGFTVAASLYSQYCHVIYAEIPDDLGWVVIE